MGPLVSVIMPAYNSEKYIKEAIISVLNQTYKNLELIVIDDKSKDHTLSIIKELALQDNRIKVLENEVNAGVSYTRNRGLDICLGDYIALLDSDDVWKEDKLERQFELINKSQVDLIYTSYALVNEDKTVNYTNFIVKEHIGFKDMLVRNEIGCSTAFFTKEIAKKYKFKEDYFHEDYVMWLNIFKDGYKAAGIKEVLVDYREMDGTRSSNKVNSAKKRWCIYREYLGFSFVKSTYYFVLYIFEGLKKHIH